MKRKTIRCRWNPPLSVRIILYTLCMYIYAITYLSRAGLQKYKYVPMYFCIVWHIFNRSAMGITKINLSIEYWAFFWINFFASLTFFCLKDNNKVSLWDHNIYFTPQVPPTYIFENGGKNLVKYFDLLKLPNEQKSGKV